MWILKTIDLSLNYFLYRTHVNLLADLASRLPIPFASAREAALELELKALQEELKELQIENKAYKNILISK